MGQGVNLSSGWTDPGVQTRPNLPRPATDGFWAPYPLVPQREGFPQNVQGATTQPLMVQSPGSRFVPGPTRPRRPPSRGHRRGGGRHTGTRFIETPDYIRDAESRYGLGNWGTSTSTMMGVAPQSTVIGDLGYGGDPRYTRDLEEGDIGMSRMWGREIDPDRRVLTATGPGRTDPLYAGASMMRTPTMQEWALQNALSRQRNIAEEQIDRSPGYVPYGYGGSNVLEELKASLGQGDRDHWTGAVAPNYSDFNRDGVVDWRDLSAANQAVNLHGEMLGGEGPHGLSGVDELGPYDMHPVNRLNMVRDPLFPGSTLDLAYEHYPAPDLARNLPGSSLMGIDDRPFSGGPMGGTIDQRSREGRLPGGASRRSARRRNPRFGVNRLSPRGGITDAMEGI